MNSFDTNILFYACNRDCSEFTKAAEIMNEALKKPEEWIIADQVYFELYRLLRNQLVLSRPLSAKEAGSVIQYYRFESGFLHAAYRPDLMTGILQMITRQSFPARRLFDVVLAVTLLDNGVSRLFTRNTKDFKDFPELQVVNPF